MDRPWHHGTLSDVLCLGHGRGRARRRTAGLAVQAGTRDRAAGFRLAFALALLGPLVWLVFPTLHKLDPLWTEGRYYGLGIAGVLLAAAGAMLAFAAQMSMGASWRVGVLKGESGALVTGGLFGFSRNPTFVGQGLLLTGLAVAVQSFPTLPGDSPLCLLSLGSDPSR